jgi:hypothetical protein
VPVACPTGQRPSWPVLAGLAVPRLTRCDVVNRLPARIDSGHPGFLIICRSWVRAPPAPPHVTCAEPFPADGAGPAVLQPVVPSARWRPVRRENPHGTDGRPRAAPRPAAPLTTADQATGELINRGVCKSSPRRGDAMPPVTMRYRSLKGRQSPPSVSSQKGAPDFTENTAAICLGSCVERPQAR